VTASCTPRSHFWQSLAPSASAMAQRVSGRLLQACSTSESHCSKTADVCRGPLLVLPVFSGAGSFHNTAVAIPSTSRSCSHYLLSERKASASYTAFQAKYTDVWRQLLAFSCQVWSQRCMSMQSSRGATHWVLLLYRVDIVARTLCCCSSTHRRCRCATTWCRLSERCSPSATWYVCT
jgi:hypothetical protein